MIPSELRVGNVIFYKGEIIQVTMVGEYGIQSKTEERAINAKFFTPDLKPIPLTAKVFKLFGILLKYGTNANSKAVYAELFENNYRVYIEKNQCWLHINLIQSFPLLKEFKSVHEFQNLMWVLSGEELDVSKLINQ